MTSKQRDSIARLQAIPGETWQGAFVRVPAWVTEPSQKPYRPTTFWWVSANTGWVGSCEKAICHPDEADGSMALDALIHIADGEMKGSRPERIEVRDKSLAAYLHDALAGVEIEIVHREHLPALDRAMSSLSDSFLKGGKEPPGYLDADGATVDHVRAFAQAAKVFYEAAPWRHLGNDDLIKIESPRGGAAFRHTILLGEKGQQFGLGFYQAIDDFWTSHGDPEAYYSTALSMGLWSLTFCPIFEIPFVDADLWHDHDLPLANDDAYPLAIRLFKTRVRRPNPKTLVFLEGLLLALGSTSEQDLLSGRWGQTVRTFDGPIEYLFSLPMFFDPPHHSMLYRHGFRDRRAMESTSSQIGRFVADGDYANLDEINAALEKEFCGSIGERPYYPPRTPLEEAQDLCYEAFDSIGRRRRVLAGQALEICADCADAYVILAEAAGPLDEKAVLYAQGVDAGMRALGDSFFTDDLEDIWSHLHARPYLRALEGSADTDAKLGRVDHAIATYRKILQLNPGDNQGISYSLVPLLIAAGQDQEAEKLIHNYGDAEEFWLYAKALLGFRAHGDGPEARKLLRQAMRLNPHVRSNLLSGPNAEDSPPYSDDEEEALYCAEHLGRAWEATPGALDWLSSCC